MASALGVIVSLLILLAAVTMPSSLALLEMRRGRFHAWAMMILFGALCYVLGGQEFSAWAQAIQRDWWRLYKVEERLRQVNLGGTAVGTGLNADRH